VAAAADPTTLVDLVPVDATGLDWQIDLVVAKTSNFWGHRLMGQVRSAGKTAVSDRSVSANHLQQSQQEKLPLFVVLVNTAAFALCFAMWVMFGPSVRVIVEELGISPAWANFIKAVPILIGAVCRVPVGILTDRLGARIMFPVLMIIAAAATLALSLVTSLAALVVGGLVMGLVGTTFVVGAQSTSSWSPREKQGFALGIFGAGNVGTAITTLGMPLLLVTIGWRDTMRVYAVVIVAAAIAYWLVMRNAPRKGAAPTFAGLTAPLKEVLAWKVGLYYMATFGVFVAATLLLSDVYIDGYGVAPTMAGVLATTLTFTASLCRIPGGWLADRLGASAVSRVSLLVTAVALAPVAFGMPLPLTVATVFIAAIAMGIGMASTFKFIPEYFPTSVGAVSGIVGALGGLGGFFLPLVGGFVKSAGGSVYLQILPLATVAAVALVVLLLSERKARSATPSKLEPAVDWTARPASALDTALAVESADASKREVQVEVTIVH
jgi:NNP family nitrate/nitrite transporter-like MFS transporter